MEGTSVVTEDTKSSERETLPTSLTPSSAPQPSVNVGPSSVSSPHTKDASIPSNSILDVDKSMASATNQTANSNGPAQIRTVQSVDKLSKPKPNVPSPATLAASPHNGSTPVRVVTLQKVASPSLNRQTPSPQVSGVTATQSRVTTTPQSPKHVLHLAANQKGSPCYTKVFQASPASQKIGQPQVASPSNLPTTVTVLRGTGTTFIVNGVPATCVTTKTTPSHYVINASPSKAVDDRNKHGHVKRPMNAFMVWARHYRQTLSRQMPQANNTDISVLLGRIWNNLPDSDKKPFYEEAEKLKREHKLTHPGWVYKPHKQKTWDPLTTTPSSPNLTGSPVTMQQSGSSSTESTPTKTSHQTTALQSPFIRSPGPLASTASPFKQPGKISCSQSPQPFTASTPSQLCSPLPSSPVIRANPASISQSSPQHGCMPRSPIITANTFSASRISTYQGSICRSPGIRASPISISQMMSTIPNASVIAPKPSSSNITYRPNQHVQVIRGPGMVAGSAANILTASTGMSAQGSITIRNKSGVCQTVPVRIGFRPTLRPTLRPVVVAPPTSSALPLQTSLTSANHLQYNIIRTNNLTNTTAINSTTGTPSALGRPPLSSLRTIVTMARPTLPMAQTYTMSTPRYAPKLTVSHTSPSTKNHARNESRPSVSKKPPPLLPIYSSTNTCVSTMKYQPAFVPITIPEIVSQPAPDKLDVSVSAIGQGYGAVRASAELQKNVQMPNWLAVAEDIVQQSPGQSLEERTPMGVTQELRNELVVSTCPVPPGSLEYQTKLTTTAISYQASTFPLQETNSQNAVYSSSITPSGLLTNPTYSIRAPIHSPTMISREHSYPRRERQTQGQDQFHAPTEDKVRYTPVSSVKQIDPEWWYLPFSPYPLDDLLQQAGQGANADARPFAKLDCGRGDDRIAGEQAPDDIQFFGEATHWQDYCDPYNPAYFGPSNTPGAELCGNIPSLNMQGWSSYLEGSVSEDSDSILGEPMVVPTNNQSTDIAAQRSVIGDQKTLINNHKGLLEKPVFINQCPEPVHTQPQLNQVYGQCQFIPEGGPLSSFVRGGRTYHVVKQLSSAPSLAAVQMPQPTATSGGDNGMPAKVCLPPRKKTRQH